MYIGAPETWEGASRSGAASTGTPVAERASTLTQVRIGIVGVGKIARDQHLPAIAASSAFTLIAATSRHGKVGELPTYDTLPAMLADARSLQAVSICTPPVGRHVLARHALESGLHVLLEKPPGATVSEVRTLCDLARERGMTLFASWHSREAAGVEPARQWLASREIRSVRVIWKEDVRFWHPGQDWIFEPGGFGVFDPAINALSILTHILPGPLVLEEATMQFPRNRAAPVAAQLRLRFADRAPVEADLDFLQTGSQTWDIEVETDAGILALSRGGALLKIDGVTATAAAATPPAIEGEYPRLYARFSQLIAQAAVDVDTRPLQLVADAFLVARRIDAAPFHF